ncbi:MAG: hypothetical protein R3183_05140 [Oleiphilaceae bacterium]|nr:hypothetical protein [Oleiphilaceae bacterium]
MDKVISACLILVGLIHLVPVTGILGAVQIGKLYGIDASEPNLEILMRHRAVLFGLLGAFLIYAAWQPTLWNIAIVAGLISVVSFIAIALSTGTYNAQIKGVVIADLIALAALIICLILHLIWLGRLSAS